MTADELRIFHPSDLTEASASAFAHAVRLVLAGPASLTVMHAGPAGGKQRWNDFPSSNELAERWGMKPPAAGAVKWVDAHGNTPVGVMLDYLDEHDFDLLVLATQGRRGFDAWFSGSMAEVLSRLARPMTLLIREGARGFVDPATGAVRIRRILVPVDHNPPYQPALDAAAVVPKWLGLSDVEVRACFVGEQAEAPDVGDHPLAVRAGAPADAIVAEAEDADLVVMVSAGPDGMIDAFRGTTAQQVVRRSPVPVLVVNAPA